MNVTILYGSATGNAEHIAKNLGKSINESKVQSAFKSADVYELNMFKRKKLMESWIVPPGDGARKHALIIVTSTTGNGDPPENAGRFVRILKKPPPASLTASCADPTQPLVHLAYSVLALGDTNYDQFCETGVNIDKKLNAWGAKRGMGIVCADEATGLEGTVEPWLDGVLGNMEKACLEDDEGEEKMTHDGEELAHDSKEKLDVSNNNSKAETKKDDTPVVQQSTPTITTPAVKTTTPSPPTTPTKSPTPLYVLYGSATGNAEGIAKDIASTYNGYLQNPSFLGYFPSVICCDLNSYKKKCMDAWSTPPVPNNPSVRHGVIIVCSTTGNADAPENADRFVRWMKRKTTLPSQPFAHCAYAVLGLGDTNYDVFCAMGNMINKRLGELGGVRAMKGVMADEATGLEEVVEPWVSTVVWKLADVCKGAVIEQGASLDKEAAKSKVVEQKSTVAPTAIAASVPPTAIAPAAAVTVPTKLKEPSSPSSAEEKKMDTEETTIPVPQTNASSAGVATVRVLLSLPSNTDLPTIPNSSLPTMVSSLSSCQLIHGEELNKPRSDSIADNMTISSTSSGFMFTASKPYESTILNARYLTGTDTACAKKVAAASNDLGDEGDENLMKAMKLYEDHFPLADTIPSANSGSSAKRQQQITYDKNGKRVLELTLALPDDFTLEYQPGDSVGLIVPNAPSPTQFILGMLQKSHGISRDQKISVDAGHPITVEEAVRSTVDLSCTMKKRWLFVLSTYAADLEEERALRLLSSSSSKSNTDLYTRYVEDQHRTVVDILQEFPSCQCITLEGLLGCLPSIPPRYYSVCSSPLHDRRANDAHYHLKVAFSVVDYLTPALAEVACLNKGRRRMGGVATRRLECVASPFLSDQASSSSAAGTPPTVQIFPKPTHDFRLPSNMSTPLILIGPGTGIAPFIGFLSHRQAQLASLDSTEAAEMTSEGTWRGGYELDPNELALSKGDAKGLNLAVDYMSKYQQVGDIDLFFGCRYSDGYDYLYQKELEEFKKDGILTNLYTAFSRRETGKKMYVQTMMEQNVDQSGQRLVEMIMEKNASVYICGDGNAMGKDVQEAVATLLGAYFCERGDCKDAVGGKVRGVAHVDQMKTLGRFVLDIWS